MKRKILNSLFQFRGRISTKILSVHQFGWIYFMAEPWWLIHQSNLVGCYFKWFCFIHFYRWIGRIRARVRTFW
jgi:hypothetical protein